MEDDANPHRKPLINAELLDYAATLLAGSGVSLDTILSLPLGPTPPPTATHPAADPTVDPAQAPEPVPALWAGWSAAARHGAPTGTTLTPATAQPSTICRNGDDT